MAKIPDPMTKPMPMLPWWPSDYFSATRTFSLAERGAYCDLLFYSWLNGPLPHEPERLARIVGVTPQEFAEVWPTVKSKFEATAQGLINHRLERERRRTLDIAQAIPRKRRLRPGLAGSRNRRRMLEAMLQASKPPPMLQAMLQASGGGFASCSKQCFRASTRLNRTAKSLI